MTKDRIENPLNRIGIFDQPKPTEANNSKSVKSMPISERFNIDTKEYRRVGFDIIRQLDDEVEEIVNVTLKDKITKKDLFNEIAELGLAAWKKKHFK